MRKQNVALAASAGIGFDNAERAMNSLHSFLIDNLWPGVVFWAVLYVSDYALTLVCARLYRQGVDQKIVFEGSFELTPYFQADIDSLRIVSPRFILAMLYGLILLSVIHWLAAQIYELLLGLMISTELAVHVRHFGNLFLFRAINNTDAVYGRIHYSRLLTLRLSSIDCLAFSALFGVLSAFASSWFLFGGAVGCLGLARKHWVLAKKQVALGTTGVATVQSVLEAELPASMPR